MAEVPMSKVIEIVQFRLKDGAHEEAFQEASESMEEGFARRQPGFLNRSLARGDEGTWVDVVFWQDLKSAVDAAEAFMGSEACMPFFGMIDEDSVRLSHYEVV
jgi:Antibiotic biosynthesis monooxygenase